MNKLKVVKNAYSLLTVCLIVVGFVLLVNPTVALSMICKIMGGFLIVFGIIKMSGYFAKDLFELAFQFDLGLGIVSIILGVIMCIKTGNMIHILSVLVGIFILVDAGLKIQTALESKRFGLGKWWLILIMAMAVAVLGILLIVLPYQTTEVMTMLIGANLVVDGIMNLFIVQHTVQTVKELRHYDL